MYRPEFEHDNCGIGFVAHIKGKKSNKIIQMGLDVLENMTHRGAEGADSKSGDGAGVLVQIPRDFYLIQGFNLPPEGKFGTGILFLPQNPEDAEKCISILLEIVELEGVKVLGFREVPGIIHLLAKWLNKQSPICVKSFSKQILSRLSLKESYTLSGKKQRTLSGIQTLIRKIFSISLPYQQRC